MTLPAIDDINTVGGIKLDADPIEDPQTQISAADWNTVAADATGMTQTCARAIARIQLNGASAPTLLAHYAVWGNTPAVAPTVTRDSAGVYSVYWPSSVTNQLGSTVSVSFKDGWVGLRPNTIKLHPYLDIMGATYQTKLYLFTSGDAASDGTSGQILTVYVF